MIRGLDWAAGIFEGEGCWYYDRSSRSLGASLRMQDKDVVESFAHAIGFGSVTGPSRTYGGRGGLYQWKIGGSDVLRLYQLIGCTLHERRRRAFFDALEKRREYESSGKARRIVRLTTPQEG